MNRLSLVIVADSDLLTDFLWVREQQLFGQHIEQAIAGNGPRCSNALDNLAGQLRPHQHPRPRRIHTSVPACRGLQRVANARFHAQEGNCNRSCSRRSSSSRCCNRSAMTSPR